MGDVGVLLVLALQLVVLPVVAGYLAYRAVGGTAGKMLGLAAGAAVAAFFAVNVRVPGK
jgi:hypothetical protein